MPRRRGGGRRRAGGRRRVHHRIHHHRGRGYRPRHGRSHRSHAPYIPPPINDANNFFFNNSDCGKYVTYGYTP